MGSTEMKEFYGKDKVTICVTDVGLGGLSVLSEVDKLLRKQPIFPEAELFYFNAGVRPGYTKRPVEDQITIFNTALCDGISPYKPDIIMIACNTLSVIYAETEYSKNATIPVVSIVEFGVDEFASVMTKDEGAAAIIFGTDTTAKVAAHRDALNEHGIGSERVVMKGCPLLATTIQECGAESDDANALLTKYVHEGWAELQSRNVSSPLTSVHAGMCCTHYGYSLPLWNAALKHESMTAEGSIVTGAHTACINPNFDMAKFIFKNSIREESNSCKINVNVVSKLPLTTEIDSIAPLLSKAVGNGLRSYSNRPDAFDHEIIATGKWG